ncbi:leucine-rich repeat and fibronectin type-III domain-containing protein 5-like [Mercenaria mercenaria]|uniref:leucine-rich repeat and fibronectin type-III domain-containing protein 5-like n=1 Tax=Mercenaria mercenaria TaxID=6596 RepID=UPI00234F43CA|nr:leucine-rich repeat and fibronectin type-III domain-containing protein 5-like [Mercenaria mercenaria]
MEQFRILTGLIFWMIFLQATVVFTCPTNCRCRGKAAKCVTGFSSFPIGLDATTEYLGISGSESQQNNISVIRQADFSKVGSLFSLAITFSGVQHVEDEAFSNLRNLHVLNLANNDIQELSANSFKGLSGLNSLDLSGNKCGFNKTIFRYIGSVEHLNLGDMNIKVLQNGLFDFVPMLKNLRLYLNGISKIPTNVFSPLKSLGYLDISSNQLSGIQDELKPTFIKIHLNLGENPWQCNCQLLWLRELPGSTIHGMIDSKEVVCNGPSNLKYASFSSIPDNMFHCVPIKIKECENISHSLEVQKTVLLSCLFEGDPKPEVKWIRPDGFEIVGRGTVNGSYELFENGTLFINNVTGYDHGEWMVAAYNKSTHVDKRIKINVITLSTSTAVYSSEALSTEKKTISSVSAPTSTTKNSSTELNLIKSEASMAITRTPHYFATEGLKSSSMRLSCSVYYVIMTMIIFCYVGKI